MKFEELKSSLISGVKPIYLIEGEDAFLRESALKLLKDGFLQEPDFNLSNLSVEDVKQDPEVLFTAVQSYPFMGDMRFVVLREYYPTAQELKSKMIDVFGLNIPNHVIDSCARFLLTDRSIKKHQDGSGYELIEQKCHNDDIQIVRPLHFGQLLEQCFDAVHHP